MTVRALWRVAALCALAACGAEPEAPPSPARSFRDATAVMGSQTDVTAAQLDGTWIVRRAFPGDGTGIGGAVTLTPGGEGFDLGWSALTCGPADCVPEEVTRAYQPSGPGRWRQVAGAEVAGPQVIWVFWVDGDRRTMAIGDPAGRYAFILDRSAEGGADRIAAAREILDWYGFDVGSMQARGG